MASAGDRERLPVDEVDGGELQQKATKVHQRMIMFQLLFDVLVIYSEMFLGYAYGL